MELSEILTFWRKETCATGCSNTVTPDTGLSEPDLQWKRVQTCGAGQLARPGIVI